MGDGGAGVAALDSLTGAWRSPPPRAMHGRRPGPGHRGTHPKRCAGAVGTDRGRVALAVWLRTGVLAALLLDVYYQAPLDRPLTLGTGLLFAGGLVLVALVVVIEVRGIPASRRPRHGAIPMVR